MSKKQSKTNEELVEKQLKANIAKLRERRKTLSKEEVEENIIEYVTYYRRNLDDFNRDILGLKLKEFQNEMIREMNDNDITDIICSRGIGKTYTTGLFATDMCLLYSNQEVVVVSFTLNQANELIETKIKRELADPNVGQSPFLRQLVKDGYIKFKHDDTSGASIVEFANGSKIISGSLGESLRGKRGVILIIDEAVLCKKKDVDAIAIPLLRPRMFKGRPLDYPEDTKIIKLTSAKSRTSWVWTDLKNCIINKFKNVSKTKYGFACFDIFNAVVSGIQSLKQLEQRKKNTDELTYLCEYLNCWIAESEDGMFSLTDFEKNQLLEESFKMPSVEDYRSGDYIRPETFKRENEIRVIASDIAMATTTGSDNDNDNTVLVFGVVNLETGRKRIEGIITLNGADTLAQTILMKRAMYFYGGDYFTFDTRTIGLGIFDSLNKPTYDVEYGIEYPAWSTCKNNKTLMCSESVWKERMLRETMQGVEVIVPIVATADSNNQMHLAMRKALRDENISLLKDEQDMRAILEDKDPKFAIKSPQEKASILINHIETRFMINEAISLEMKFLDSGNIKLVEGRNKTKDRIITCEYFNLFCDKLINQYEQELQTPTIDMNDWSFLSGNFSNF